MQQEVEPPPRRPAATLAAETTSLRLQPPFPPPWLWRSGLLRQLRLLVVVTPLRAGDEDVVGEGGEGEAALRTPLERRKDTVAMNDEHFYSKQRDEGAKGNRPNM